LLYTLSTCCLTGNKEGLFFHIPKSDKIKNFEFFIGYSRLYLLICHLYLSDSNSYFSSNERISRGDVCRRKWLDSRRYLTSSRPCNRRYKSQRDKTSRDGTSCVELAPETWVKSTLPIISVSLRYVNVISCLLREERRSGDKWFSTGMNNSRISSLMIRFE